MKSKNNILRTWLRGAAVAALLLAGSGAAQAQVTIGGHVFGGGNNAPVGKGTTVVIDQTGATITGDVYGGGALAEVDTVRKSASPSDAGVNDSIIVKIYRGNIRRNVYGGGLGDSIPYGGTQNVAAHVYGPIHVYIGNKLKKVNEPSVDSLVGSGVTIGGEVFGCNNLNGSPKSNVLVDIWQTAHNGTNTYPDPEPATVDALATPAADNCFAIAAVYGGGNKASYAPVESSDSAQVHIHTCLNTIKTVYGGGNAANATDVKLVIEGGRFDRIFGGGNGYSETGNHNEPSEPNYNPGANITSSATTEIHGGLYRQVFGGSNQYGDVANATLSIDKTSSCTELIYEAFGGANEADINGSITTTLACGDIRFGNFYGGSNKANIISGDVTLNVYGGTYTNVFGGSKGTNEKAANIGGDVTLNLYGGHITNAFGGSDVNGNITGSITVNVVDAETENCELDVTNIYGAGNLTPYTPTTPGAYPEVNINHIKSGNSIHGDVFGGGLGKSATVTSNPVVNIGDVTSGHLSTITGRVFGGGSEAPVSGSPTVNVYNGTAPTVYGGGLGSTAEVTGTTAVVVNKTADKALTLTTVYGGGEEAPVTGATTVTLTAGTLTNAFGGGNVANVTGTSTVTLQGATVANVYGGGNQANVSSTSTVTLTSGNVTGGLYGGCNTTGSVGNVVMTLTGGTVGTDASHRANVFGGGYGSSTTTTGDIGITLGSTTIYGDLYGGSALGGVNNSTSNTTTLTINGGNLYGTLFGGGQGDATYTALSKGNVVINYNTANSNLIDGIYGGANVRGNVKGNIEVNVLANVGATGNGNSRDIFGGGLGQNTTTEGNVTVTVGNADGTKTPTVYGDIYGGSALGSVNNAEADLTTVNFLNGTLHGNIFGGGLGDKASLNDPEHGISGHSDIAAAVNGTVTVNISNSTQTEGNCHIDLTDASVYGCNNTNGSPQGNVTVNIYKTAHTTTDSAVFEGAAPLTPTYAIANVFGGGKQADYAPENGLASSTKKATVTVYGCTNTIEDLFGGGDAAASVGVVTVVNGGRFDRIFGGGNGEVTAANIGLGGTNLTVHGGYINHLFGGSNEQGVITGSMAVAVDNTSGCGEEITEFFGGSNLADLGTAQNPITLTTTIACGTVFGDVYGGCNLADITGNVTLTINGGTIANAYAGSKGRAADNSDPEHPIAAKAADITGDVALNIYGGTITNAFGGSNINGNITGSITVNMDWSQSDCAGKSLTNLYGASNDAAYTPTSASGAYPEVNVIHGTVGGSVFGGGKGSTATVTSNPVVTIGDNNGSHLVNVTGNVYGGGDAAAVTGNTTVEYKDNNASSTVAKLFGGGNAASVSGTTSVTLTAGTVTAGLYGGCNASGSVGAVTVALSGGAVGTALIPSEGVYGGGYGSGTSTTGNIGITLGSTTLYGDLYGGSALGAVNASTSNTTTLTINGSNLHGTIYGGGKGSNEGLGTTALSNGNVLINYNTDNSGLTGFYGGANINGSVAGDIEVNVLANVGASDNGNSRDVFGGGLGANTSTNGDVTVTIGDGSHSPTLYGDVYGGSSLGEVGATSKIAKVDLKAGTLNGTIYGGGKGQVSPSSIAATVTGGTEVDVSGGTVTGGLYGGGNINGSVAEAITVSLTGGTVGVNGVTNNAVFGGGLGAHTTTGSNVTVTLNGATVYGALYGGSALGSVNDAVAELTTVHVLSGEIHGNVYGGGLGKAGAADSGQVNGTITVNIGDTDNDKDNPSYTGSATIDGSVYGCNNTNGSPQGDVTVNIYSTAHTTTPIDNTTAGTAYAIANVFGGGRNASFTTMGKKAYVNVFTCYNTIGTLYGGGDAAEVPGSDVTIWGGRFDKVFGGGNGAGVSNPGANIGDGGITIAVHGGNIGTLVNASNEKGSIGGSINVTVDNEGGCDEEVDEFFGGSNMVDITGDVTTTIECGAGTFGAVYGGSNKADITGSVSLTIQGGTIGRVFGGSKGDLSSLGAGHIDKAANITGNVTLTLNGGTIGAAFGGSNINGSIGGTITVNVTDLGGTCPLAIDSVFGAGNLTAYTGSPVVNINHGTVGNLVDGVVFGGGKQAAVTGNPVVTIGDGVGGHNAAVTGKVFGGGDEAGITGSTHVVLNSGTVGRGIYGGCNTEGTVTVNSTVDLLGGQVGASASQAEIFGGGYGESTEVSGNVQVTMGNTAGTYTPTIYGELYGGSALGNVNTNSSNTTTVDILSGTLNGIIYGGGRGRKQVGTLGDEGYVAPVAALVNGVVHVNVGAPGTPADPLAVPPVPAGDPSGSANLRYATIYGCNNLNGSPQHDVYVDIYQTAHTTTDAANYSGDDRDFAINYVYGGGNQADYAPAYIYRRNISGLDSAATFHSIKKVHVSVHGCDNTIYEAYGGGNAAAVLGDSVVFDGGRHSIIFGGGNGAVTAANVDIGGVSLTAKGGHVGWIYEHCNKRGIILGPTTFDTASYKGSTGACNGGVLKVDYHFCGGNEVDIAGDFVYKFTCSQNLDYDALYGGCRLGTTYGNITLIIEGGTYNKIYGGPRGDKGFAASVKKYPTDAQLEVDYVTPWEDDATYGHKLKSEDELVYAKGIHEYMNKAENKDKQGTGGNVTIILKGGTIGRVYGGCELNGNVEGKITIVVDSLERTTCPLDINNIYGASDLAQYHPDDSTWNTPLIALVKGHVNQNIFGGGRGIDTTINAGRVAACPKIIMGGQKLDTTALRTSYTQTLIVAESRDKFLVKGDIFGGGEMGPVDGSTTVAIASGSVLGSVYGGGKGNSSHPSFGLVTKNTNVTMTDGYVGNGIFGGGMVGSVGTFTRSTAAEDVNIFGHTTHAGCLGKPTACAENTGKCTVVVTGGQIGPVTVATVGMDPDNSHGGPVAEGWVWGASCGSVEDPATHPDVHFSAYVGSTDVTIGGTAFIMEGIIGGGEFGRVLGNTLVKIQDHCQIGVGAGQTEIVNGVLKPKRYTDGYDYGNGATINQFIDPTVTPVTESNALAECSHFVFGRDTDDDDVKDEFLTYDPYFDEFLSPAAFAPASTNQASNGGTWIGVVFGGGSGYMPYRKDDGTGYEYSRSAGWVEGNSEVRITGGHILTNVYGGNEYTDVQGSATVTMTGGTIGVPRTVAQIAAHPVTCYLFGAGKGDERTYFNTMTNVGSTVVSVSGGIIYGSVFGGGEDGHVLGNTSVTINGTAKIGTIGTSYVDGNVFGGGRGFSGIALTAGNVGGDVDVDICGSARLLGSVYGGGRLASVGYGLYPVGNANYGVMRDDNVDDDGNPVADFPRGHITVDIYGDAVIGNDVASDYTSAHSYGGNVFGGSMGRLTKLDGTMVLPLWHRLGCAKATTVNIRDNVHVKGNVYGGSELGTVTEDITVNISGNVTVGRKAASTTTSHGNVYGGGYGHPELTAAEKTQVGNDATSDSIPTFAGLTGGTIQVNISGGAINNNVYGAGELASVGTIDEVIKHTDSATTYYLSWPYEYTYHGTSGDARVNITGGKIGYRTGSTTTGGDIFGSARGTVGDRYVTGKLATARVTHVDINLAATTDTIFGTVYGSGENGHVYDSAVVTLRNGLVLGSVFGGGKGTDQYTDQLKNPTTGVFEDAQVYDIIAGKVFGNTKVNILGGRVAKNVYGGGNLASVGKGNYKKYGEGPNVSAADSLLAENSGHCYVNILGGVIGPDSILAGTIYNGSYAIPDGHVYGAGKGIVFPTAAKVGYAYNRDYYVAYVNKTFVIIGDSTQRSCDYKTVFYPHVTASVFGGGENGHVRFDTYVQTNRGIVGVRPLDSVSSDVGHWAHRGNVWGAGRGEDLNPDGSYCQSAGSVTRNTTIDILGARIYRNIMGGGAMASVGPIKGRTGDSSTCVINVRLPLASDTLGGPGGRTVTGHTAEKSFGGYIGGGSRGIPSPDGTDNSHLATCHNSQINLYQGYLKNTIYGGGENGQMLGNTEVNVYGGYVRSAIYGGGKGSWMAPASETFDPVGDYSNDTLSGYIVGNTTVNLLGGWVAFPYGGCRRASIGGDATVNIGKDNGDGTYSGEVSFNSGKDKVYGGNQYAGSPRGNIYVNVYKTAHTPANEVSGTDYAINYVYGGSYNSPYVPRDSGHYAQVHVYGCENTINEVYGGCASANVGAKPGIGANTKLIIDGGRFNNVYGGGDGTFDRYLGSAVPANIYGAAITEIRGGTIGSLYGGSNFMGQADTIRISVKSDGPCGTPVQGDEFFGGSNMSNLGPTELSTTLGCGVNFRAAYGGSNQADITGNVTLIIEGGQYDEVYAGSKGAIVAASASDGMKDTVKSDITGNTHLIIKGGTIHSAFGGSNINGNITGTITVDVDSTYDDCDWKVDYVYGGSNLTQYTPDDITVTNYKYSPKVNIIQGTVDTNVFGGGRGTKDNKLDGLVRCNTQVNVSGGQVKGNVYGGGEKASIDGDAYVNVSGGIVGPNVAVKTTGPGGDSLSCVYGGGKGIGDDPSGTYRTFTNVNNTHVAVSGGRVCGSVFGGAEDGHVLGNTNVTVSNTVASSAYAASHDGVDEGDVLSIPIIGTGGYTHEYDGCVLGGGRNALNKNASAGRVQGNTNVTVTGGRIMRSVFGGGALARVGVNVEGSIVDAQGGISTDLRTKLKKKNSDVDSTDGSGNPIYVYDFTNHGSTVVDVSGTTDTVLGVRKKRYNYDHVAVNDSLGLSVEDSITYKDFNTTTYNIPGTDSVVIFYTTIGGPDDSTLVDNDYTIGDIFGGGKGDTKDTADIFAGRVMNTYVTVHGSPRIMADIYAGGEMSCIGWYDTTRTNPKRDEYYDNTGYTHVTVSGNPYGGTPFEFSETNIHGGRAWTLIDSTGRLYHTCSGNIYGGGQGYVEEGYRRIHNWVQMGRVRKTDVQVSGGRFLGNVFGGGSRGIVKEDCHVTITGGHFGTVITDKRNNKGDKRYYYGSIFGGGYGNPKTFWHYNDSCFVKGDTIFMRPTEYAGRVYGDTRVDVSGGHIMGNVFGGGDLASTGWVERDADGKFQFDDSTKHHGGLCVVNISGTVVIGPLDGTEMNGEVYGAGKGVGHDRDEVYKTYCNVNGTQLTVSGGHIYGSTFGGGADCHVLGHTRTIIKDSADIGSGEPFNDGHGGYSQEYDGCVIGGGRNALNITHTAGRVQGNSYVIVTGGRIRRSVIGGGALARTGVDTAGVITPYIINGKYDSTYHGTTFVDVSGTTDTINGTDHIGKDYYGNNQTVIGFSPEDSVKYARYLGTTDTMTVGGAKKVVVYLTAIGAPDDTIIVVNDYTIGDIFGGGKGDTKDTIDILAGKVMNTSVKVHGSPRIMADIYAGGEMSCIGWYDTEGADRGKYYDNTGYTRVVVSDSPYTGTPYEFSQHNIHAGRKWTLIDSIGRLYHTCSGNVYGGGQGYVEEKATHSHNWVQMGRVRYTTVTIGGGRFMGNIFGGGSRGFVMEDCDVKVNGGTIGCVITDNLNPRDDSKRYYYGSVFGGGYGNHKVFPHKNDSCFVKTGNDTVLMMPIEMAGRVYGNTYVTVKGGHIMNCVFGGGDMASTGWVERNLANGDYYYDTPAKRHGGICTVSIEGGEIGPLDMTGHNAYVYGAGRGIPSDSTDKFKHCANVNETHLTVSGGKIWGSTFGGGADSHVLGDVNTIVEGDADLGTRGSTSYDGNIFGGGRNFLNTNHTNGRVQGNVYVTMTGGTLQGTIFGGGRMALTGVDSVGHFIDSLHGNVDIQVRGNSTIGNSNSAELLMANESVGDIFGAGKGDTKNYEDVWAGRVTNATITIQDDASGNSPRIHGSVFGGGEMASLGWWDDTIKNNSGTVIFHTKDDVSGGSYGTNYGTFYANTGKATISITGEVTIGTYDELTRYTKPTHAIQGEREGTENPGMWTMYNPDGSVLHTCTGNVFGGGQGDIDRTKPRWVSMGRSRTSTVTIGTLSDATDGPTIMGCVFGGAEQGIITGDVSVTINSGTIGTHVTSGSGAVNNYTYGDVYGAGYGCDDESEWGDDDWQSTTEPVNDSTAGSQALHLGWNPGLLAGRTFGNATVDVLGGHIRGSVYGGGSFASLGDDKSAGYNATTVQYPINGKATVNIGSGTVVAGFATDVSGNATIDGNVFGANNYKGTPYGNTEVNIYRTAHTSDDVLTVSGVTVVRGNEYPAGLKALEDPTDELTEEDVASDKLTTEDRRSLGKDSCFALAAVYGGGNLASHTPLDEVNGTTLVHVYKCEENTIKYVYGGGNAAATRNNHVIVDGGRIKNLFGGGNGYSSADNHSDPDGVDYNPGADVLGTATTEIHGGVFDSVYAGSNQYGYVHNSSLTIDNTSGCEELIGNAFGGGNEAVGGGGEITLGCGARYENFYAGANNADIGSLVDWDRTPRVKSNIILNIEGGVYENLFGGNNAGGVIYGDVTVNIHGGQIHNLFGGNNAGGNIMGSIEVNIDFDPDYACADGLRLDNIYGGGRDAAYSPYDPFHASPVVNVKNNRVKLPSDPTTAFTAYTASAPSSVEGDDSAFVKIYDVFGGGLGASARVTAYPRIVVGGFQPKTRVLNEGTEDETTEILYTRKARVYHNLYGGGSAAPVDGNTTVYVCDATIGTTTDHTYPDGGMVFGGGYGLTSTVQGNTVIGVYGLSEILNNVYGGGNAGIVTGKTHTEVAFLKQVFPPEIEAFPVIENDVVTAVKANFVIRGMETLENKEFYYTTDGTKPDITNHAQRWDGTPITLEYGHTVHCIATIPGYIPSAMMAPMMPSPDIIIDETDPANPKVSFNSTVGSRVRYTLDGTDPDGNSDVYCVVGETTGTPVALPAESVVKVIAEGQGCETSPVTYLTSVQPTITVEGSTVTITSPHTSDHIVYTTDGSTPVSSMIGQTPHGTHVESNSVTLTDVASGTTIKAITKHRGYMPSQINAVIVP